METQYAYAHVCRSHTVWLTCQSCVIFCLNPVLTQELRLIGDPSTGARVEIKHNGEWGLICAKNPTLWTQNNAKVVCRQLKQPKPASDVFVGVRTGVSPPSSNLSLLTQVHCQGWEPTLGSCLWSKGWREGVDGCTAENAVGVVCGGQFGWFFDVSSAYHCPPV